MISTFAPLKFPLSDREQPGFADCRNPYSEGVKTRQLIATVRYEKRNTYANYLAICLPSVLWYALAQVRQFDYTVLGGPEFMLLTPGWLSLGFTAHHRQRFLPSEPSKHLPITNTHPSIQRAICHA
jgi:hypothetical protein